MHSFPAPDKKKKKKKIPISDLLHVSPKVPPSATPVLHRRAAAATEAARRAARPFNAAKNDGEQ